MVKKPDDSFADTEIDLLKNHQTTLTAPCHLNGKPLGRQCLANQDSNTGLSSNRRKWS